MKVHRRPRAQAAISLRQQAQPNIDARRRQQCARLNEPIAAGDVAPLDTGEIQSATLPAASGFRRPALRMNTPHTRLAARGHYGESLAHVNSACEGSPGDDRSVTG